MGGKSKSNQSSTSQNVNTSQGVNSSAGMNYGVNQSGNYGFNQGDSQNTSNSFGGSQNTSSSSGGSQNSSQSTQDVWGNQAGYLDDVYGQAQGAFNQGMNQVNELTPQVNNQIQDAYGQAQGGFGNQMDGGFASALQGQVGPNSYVDAMKGQVADDAQLLKQQNLGGLDARAAAAGMSGSSGYRDQVNDMSNQVDKNALNQMSQIGYNAHDSGIRNQLALSQQMDSNQQFGTSNLQNMQQGAMNQFNPAMVGQNMVGQYAQTIGGPTVLGNSSSQGSSSNTSTSQGTSNNSSMSQGTSNNMGTNMGFSNGLNIGMNQSGGFNNGYGYGNSQGQGNSSSWNVQPPNFSFV